MHTGEGVYVGGVGKFQGCPYRSRKWGYMKTIQLSNYPTIQLFSYPVIQQLQGRKWGAVPLCPPRYAPP